MKSSVNIKLYILVFMSLDLLPRTITQEAYNVNYMELGSEINITSSSSLQIFCYRGQTKQILYIWQSVSFRIKISNDNFEQYEGFTPPLVYEEYQQRRSSWTLGFFNNKKTAFNINPFNQSCIGISAEGNFSVNLNNLRIDFWKLVMLILGLILFHGGARLSNNTFFYYASGIAIGVCASFLILIYLLSKMIPKRPAMYSFVIGGWTLAVYFLQILWDNLRIILINYKTYVIWYVITSGFISFIVCYKMGPIKDRKNKNIIRWTLQCAGLLLVALHTDYQEAAFSICCIMIISKYFPKSIAQKSQKMWRRKFPPKPILLTSEEYYAQGVVETCKALQELRQHCSSPECKQWNTIRRLKNVKSACDLRTIESHMLKSSRFAGFVEGESHLTDQEILDYDSDEHYSYEKTNNSQYRRNGQINLTDDEEDSDRISEDSFDSR